MDFSMNQSMPSVFTDKWHMVASGYVGGIHLIRTVSTKLSSGASTHDGQNPVGIELKTIDDRWIRALCLVGIYVGGGHAGHQTNPHNIIIERIKGQYALNRGAEVMSNPLYCSCRPAVMRTRRTIPGCRLTRPESNTLFRRPF